MTFGPLVQVDTLVEGINLDISRALYTGPGNLLFKVPDTSQITNLRTVLTLTQGFDRIPVPEGGVTRDGIPVIFQVADLDGSVALIIEEKDLMIEHKEELFKVAHVSKITESEAQAYTFNCRSRNLRNRYFDTK